LLERAVQHSFNTLAILGASRSRWSEVQALRDAPTPLYFRRNCVLRAAPLLNAQGPGSSSPGWRTPPCGTCVPRSTGTGVFGLHHND